MGLWAGCQEKLLCGVPVVAKWGQGRWFLSLGDCLVWSLLLMEAAHGVGSAQLTLQREQRWKRERNTVGEGKGGVWGKLCPSAIQCLLGDLRFHVICFSFMSMWAAPASPDHFVLILFEFSMGCVLAGFALRLTPAWLCDLPSQAGLFGKAGQKMVQFDPFLSFEKLP